jgi:hypothetical protein
LNLLVGRIVAHSSHQVRQLVDWDLALKLASFGRVFLLGTNHRVVEEVVDVLVGLALGTTFNQLNERLDALTAHRDRLLNRVNVDVPHVDGKISSTACENILSIGGSADILHFVGMSNQTHRLVRVAIERQLDEADDLLVGGVKHVLLSVASVLLEQLQLGDLTTIGRSETSSS